MKIVFQHSRTLPVLGYGGIERIIFWHMVELARLGHQVVLIGHPESKVCDYGIELIACTDGDPTKWEKLVPLDADIVHLSYNYRLPGNIPTIATVHGNGQMGEIFIKNSVFVSKKHAEIHGSNQFVHNAIDLNEYPYEPKKYTNDEKKWEQFLFLAKASWRVKNLAHAAKACRKTKKHLHVAGGRWWGLSRYIHNHGIIGGDEKMQIMRSSDAMIFPVRWHEPFGIAVIEAMSQGLPVIGSPYGSLPEIISTDTGFIVKNYQELVSVLKNPVKTFDPKIIRKHVEDNFGIRKHAESYLVLYEKVIKGMELNQKEPTYQFNVRAQDLLPF
ncbi:MAG: glycosyltransferase [Bacteriovorax sp.]|nr:glycosyltransferase [Bacteriovorax sp.]